MPQQKILSSVLHVSTLICVPAYAADNDPIQVLQIGKLLAGLIFVCVIIVVLAWLYKRFGIVGLQANHAIELESVLTLGNKEKLVIIKADNRRLLLGVTQGNINNLAELAKADPGNFQEKKQTQEFAFSSLLQRLQQKGISDE